MIEIISDVISAVMIVVFGIFTYVTIVQNELLKAQNDLILKLLGGECKGEVNSEVQIID